MTKTGASGRGIRVGGRGVRRAGARPPGGDLIADIGLPGEDGYSFIRRVRAHSIPSIQSVPAIAVTAYTSIPDRAEALAVGFQQHLPKPIDPARLIEAVYEVTRAQR